MLASSSKDVSGPCDESQVEETPFPFYVPSATNLYCSCLKSDRDDLPKNLGKNTTQECKKSVSD